MTIQTANTLTPFAVADGVARSYRIRPDGNGFTGIPQIVRNDWRGASQLSAAPRKNWLHSSEDFTSSIWQKGANPVTPNVATAPDGSSGMDEWTHLASTANYLYLAQTVGETADASGKWTFSVWVSVPSGASTIGVGISDVVATTVGSVQIPVNTVPRLLTFTVQPGQLTNTGFVGVGFSGIAGQRYRFWGAMLVQGDPQPYIPSPGSTATTVTDFSLDSNGYINLGEVPQSGATLSWKGAYAYTPDAVSYDLAHRTIVGQYQNSATLVQLIKNFSDYIDPTNDFNSFVDTVWNIDTAAGFGLDVIGRILNIPRQLNVPAIFPVTVAPGIISLTDAQYRPLLIAKAMSNIGVASSAGINQVLKTWFASRGNAFAVNLGNMHAQYRFLFALSAVEYGMILQTDAVPNPTGVKVDLMSVQPYFGFAEALSWSTFDENSFATY